MVVSQNGIIIVSHVQCADSFMQRLKGLMFRASLPPDEGLLLKDCSSIHTCFMRFPIDVIYLSSRCTVLYVETVVPWRCGRLIKGTRHILELAAGSAESVQLGEPVQIHPASRENQKKKIKENPPWL